MKIIFTSCMNAERTPDQPIWDAIRKREPDVLLLLGDQIYMDWRDLGASNWRKRYHGASDEPAKNRILKEFATEMHWRYKQQWEVNSFRELIESLHSRGGKVLLTWDDHDFSWNNSLGVDNPIDKSDAYQHGTPESFKHISGRLFLQFKAHLQSDEANEYYPDLPTDVLVALVSPIPPAYEFLTLNDGVECLVLDGRWFKTPRNGHQTIHATLLGAAQKSALEKAVKVVGRKEASLLIVACGSPAVHDYLISSQQDWRGSAPNEPAYPEYDILTQAKRPVLFLAGDIHRNAWGGVLPTTVGKQSQVIQLLSSGAAIPPVTKIFGFELKKTEPRFCEIKIESGCVTPKFYRAEGDHLEPTFIEEFRMGQQPLTYNQVGWTSHNYLQGEAWDTVPYPADRQPLLVLHARKRKGNTKPHTELNNDSSLEELWDPMPDEGMKWPESFDLSKFEGGWSIESHCASSTDQDGGARSCMQSAIQKAFDRADGKPIVLFVHGFGKSLVDAVHQAHGLRELYQCEPILLAWEALRIRGVKDAVGFKRNLKSNVYGATAAAYNVFDCFAQLASKNAERTSIVLARSAGSLLLHAALEDRNLDLDEVKSISRFVLSAPLIKLHDFKKSSLGRLGKKVTITRNQRDQVLNLADFVDGGGKIVGFDNLDPGDLGDATMLDFTQSERVHRQHDYLWLKLNEHQVKVHEVLLSAKFDLEDLAKEGHFHESSPLGERRVLHVK